MKLIESGYGGSGEFNETTARVYQDKTVKYAYLATRTFGGNPEMIGGSFHWEIFGTNSIRELMQPKILKKGLSVTRKKDGRVIKDENLAREYIAGLSEGERRKLIDEVLLDYLTK